MSAPERAVGGVWGNLGAALVSAPSELCKKRIPSIHAMYGAAILFMAASRYLR